MFQLRSKDDWLRVPSPANPAGPVARPRHYRLGDVVDVEDSEGGCAAPSDRSVVAKTERPRRGAAVTRRKIRKQHRGRMSRGAGGVGRLGRFRGHPWRNGAFSSCLKLARS